jgi:hypothetical protein
VAREAWRMVQLGKWPSFPLWWDNVIIICKIW